MTGKTVVTGSSLSDLYPNDVEKVTSALLKLKNVRSKSGESYNDEDVKNVMICLPCREKYYADNIVKDSYVPSRQILTNTHTYLGAFPSARKLLRNTQQIAILFMDWLLHGKNLQEEEAHGSMCMTCR